MLLLLAGVCAAPALCAQTGKPSSPAPADAPGPGSVDKRAAPKEKLGVVPKARGKLGSPPPPAERKNRPAGSD